MRRLALLLALSLVLGVVVHAVQRVPLGIKGSEQEGLTGVKGSILRTIVVDKTRSSLESALASIKRSVERSEPRR